MKTDRPSLGDFRFVFVGLGGTFFMGTPAYSVLLRKYGIHNPIFMDPKGLTSDNLERQWPTQLPGQSKVLSAAQALAWTLDHSEYQPHLVQETFDPNEALLIVETDKKPVLAIVNVDNNQARMAVREWLMHREGWGIMVVSGCERDYGQAYPGIWKDGECIHDWLTYHPDVADNLDCPKSSGSCQVQTAMANTMTATCSSIVIQGIEDWLATSYGSPSLREAHWEGETEGEYVRLWTDWVVASRTNLPLEIGGREVNPCGG